MVARGHQIHLEKEVVALANPDEVQTMVVTVVRAWVAAERLA